MMPFIDVNSLVKNAFDQFQKLTPEQKKQVIGEDIKRRLGGNISPIIHAKMWSNPFGLATNNVFDIVNNSIQPLITIEQGKASKTWWDMNTSGHPITLDDAFKKHSKILGKTMAGGAITTTDQVIIPIFKPIVEVIEIPFKFVSGIGNWFGEIGGWFDKEGKWLMLAGGGLLAYAVLRKK